jgi:hypothetical protein
MSKEIKEAAKKVKELLNEVHEIISSTSIRSGFQTEVQSTSGEPRTSEEQYLLNVKFQLGSIK